MGLNMDEQKAVERFKSEVVEPSMSKLVILDFHAEWCGPCKALAPMLEKVAAEYADKGVVLKKVDVDAEKFIAAQFQVQSIPTVYAMFQGQPVAGSASLRAALSLSRRTSRMRALLSTDTAVQLPDRDRDPRAWAKAVGQTETQGLTYLLTYLLT